MKRHLNYLLIIETLTLVFATYFILSSDGKESVIVSTENNHTESIVFKVGEEEGEVIRELIITMARTNPAVLAFKKGRLEALGVKLRSKVTTFEFLAFVFRDPQLAKEMKLLQESSIKYKRFVEGFFPKMLKEYEKEGFYLRAEHFANHLEIDQLEFIQILKECLGSAQSGDRGAFKPLIDYLIAVKNQ